MLISPLFIFPKATLCPMSSQHKEGRTYKKYPVGTFSDGAKWARANNVMENSIEKRCDLQIVLDTSVSPQLKLIC